MDQPRPEHLHGHHVKIAVLVQLPDGRIVSQWGVGTVTTAADRADPEVWPPGAPLFPPPTEHTTAIAWAGGYTLRWDMPDWGRPTPQLPQQGVPVYDDHGHYQHMSVKECGEHRTVGSYRSWCHDCGEWCYPRDPCVRCKVGSGLLVPTD